MVKKNSLKIYNISIIISFVLAIVVGFLFPNFMTNLSFLGSIYINLLKFVILPIIFTSIAVTSYKFKDKKGLVVVKTILTFIIMFVLTFLITSLLVILLKPGVNFSFKGLEWNSNIEDLNASNIIVNLFPSNIITMFQSNSLFATIVFALLFGVAASKVENGKKAIDVVDSFKNIFYKILEYIMYLTPIGIFSLLGVMIANYKMNVIEFGVRYVLMAYFCSFIALLPVMMVPICIKRKISPLKYFKKMRKVFLMTITTCSSVATLPTTIKTCKDEFNVKESTTDIVVPLGCTIHMCGGAVSFALLSIFCCQCFDISITLPMYLMMIFSATLINMAAPGIPNGGIVLGATYLSLLNIPLSFMGIYSGIYKLLDMAYTTLNVSGDVTANVIIDN